MSIRRCRDTELRDAPLSILSAELLALLRCPESRQPLRPATLEELGRAKLEAGLAREDGCVVYPIVEGIPMLMAEHAVRIGVL